MKRPQKTNRHKTLAPRLRCDRKPLIQSLEERQLLAVDTFQQGVEGYTGQEDTVLYSRTADVNSGTEGSISPDQQDANGVRQGLVQFRDIIGDENGQIPLGARINSATLKLDVVNDSNSGMQMSFYRMLVPWSESTATWNSFGEIGGVQASEGESSDLPPDGIVFDPDTTANSPTAGIVDVSRSLEYWSAGAANYGWMIESAATNGWDFRTKEGPVAQRPQLTVDWEVPATLEYKILPSSLVVAEGDAGETVTARIDVARYGPIGAPSSVSFSATAGTAGAGDFVAIPSGTLNFAAGEGLATIEITINGDDALEGLETINVALSGSGIVPGRGTSVVIIGDDDALINEVLANVSNAVDETDREYIELIGTPGASLDGYFFVVFESEEEEVGDGGELDGSGAGVADFVFDLSGHAFGANGLLVIAPTNWQYQSLASPETTIVNTVQLDGAGGILEDNSQTYALIRSPNAPIVQGTDYDTIGAYENASNQAIGVGVGILDQLPAGADVVDSVGVVEGGGGDRDRTATPEFLGHPGIHVHQPTSIISGGNVTSDAVSRRFRQKLPNSIGAWYNGDIPDGDGGNGRIPYANDSFFISVVAPDGSVLTPGAPNVLRNVFFSVADQAKEVAEADGSVTLTIERSGDFSSEISVTYQTVDIGSATQGADYTAVQQTVVFAPGESSKQITINLVSDGEAEGFERFRVEITEVTGGYLITNGRANDPGLSGGGVPNGEAIVTIVDANVSTATFQQFVNGYEGTSDAYLDGEQIFDKFGQDPVIRVDQVKGEGEFAADVVRPQQGLIRFDDLFGAAANQVPAGSQVFDAFLTVNVQNVSSGADVRFFRMLQDWEQVNATWVDPQGSRGNSILNGVTPDNVEAASVPDARVPEPGRAGLVQIPLNVDTIQAWANGSLPNYGWSIVSDSGSLWAFNSSEAFLPGTAAPELTILYTDPDPADAGTFSLAVDQFTVNEDSTATITVNRIGGASGAATVNWALSAGTGDLSDITGPTNGSISFAAGELFKTFNIAINDDNVLETNETLNITLSGSGRSFDRMQAELLIRDNDFRPFAGNLLLNEFWINSPGNDPPYEFVELSGVPGLPMGSLYYVAIEGLIGDREGSAEKVVDLGAFANGSAAADGRGYTLITPDAADFGHQVPAGATQIDGLGSIGEENVASQNDSTTYMLLYSPFTSLTLTEFDYDWDNDGALELPSGVQIVDSVGVRVLGEEDQLYGPSTNQATFELSDPDVDAISRFRGDTRANEGDAWFGGDLFPAGDDYLLYEADEAFNLPVAGAALSPGEPNTGSAEQSPLVSLIGVVANGDGSVTANFSGPVSQLNAGDGSSVNPGGSGITITDPSGAQLPTVNPRPTVSGFGTNTLTLTFGAIPAGSYRLNFVGNALIGNGRAVDVANNGSASGGFFTFAFSTSGGGNPDDVNGDGVVDLADLDLLCGQVASGAASVSIVDSFRARNAIPSGDSNFDGEFNSSDLVAAFSAGLYELGEAALWSQGDWNCDGQFNSSDLVAAFAAGFYEQGPIGAVAVSSSSSTAQNRLLAAAVDELFDEGDDGEDDRKSRLL